MTKYIILLLSLSFQLYGVVNESIISLMDKAYSQDFRITNVNHNKLRVMTFNMLYNVKTAEDKLPVKHRWPCRKPRLLEYLDYAKADIISSQELQEDQVQELISALGPNYGYYGLKTRENEGRSDINAIFFNASRFELIEAKTIPYADQGGNGFTYCHFRDKFLDRKFVVMNTKLSWGVSWSAMKKRLSEATQLKLFVDLLPAHEPILLTGDFNTLPFLDGKSIVQVLTEGDLKDAKTQSLFGHFGPFCSINNSSIIFTPFTGPELTSFILDRIFVNQHVRVFTHGIDIAKINGEYASDHFPVIADLCFD